MMHHLVAVIGDLVESRKLTGTHRSEIQHRLLDALTELNQDSRVISDFVITIGDEFQGLLTGPDKVPDMIWMLKYRLHPVGIRFGVGFGNLQTELKDRALGMDGPVWHHARRAIDKAKEQRLTGGVFSGFGEDWDQILTEMADPLQFMREQLTDNRREILNILRSGDVTHGEIASRLGKSRQAVSKAAAEGGWDPYRHGESALRGALKKAVSEQRSIHD